MSIIKHVFSFQTRICLSLSLNYIYVCHLVLNIFTSIIQENIPETVSEEVYLPKIRNQKRRFPDKQKLMWKL